MASDIEAIKQPKNNKEKALEILDDVEAAITEYQRVTKARVSQDISWLDAYNNVVGQVFGLLRDNPNFIESHRRIEKMTRSLKEDSLTEEEKEHLRGEAGILRQLILGSEAELL